MCIYENDVAYLEQVVKSYKAAIENANRDGDGSLASRYEEWLGVAERKLSRLKREGNRR